MIDDTVLAGRIPRLGTITTGRGVEAISQRGATYARPTRAKTFVVHTNDGAVAIAAQVAFGGDVHTDSPTWDYDVLTDVREIPVTVLVNGFRQSLELWRSAECVRRCDGVRMSTLDGRPVDEPCRCAAEMLSGAERACRPSTILPVLLDLDVERFGIWEVRSNAWGTAASLKGAVRALTLAGSSSASVPAVLSMVDRTVRDAEGKTHDVTEIHLTIAQSHAALAAGVDTAALPAPPLDGDARRAALLVEWSAIQQQAHTAGLRDALRDAWRSRGLTARTVEELDVDDLADWIAEARTVIERREGDGGSQSAPLPAANPDPATA